MYSAALKSEVAAPVLNVQHCYKDMGPPVNHVQVMVAAHPSTIDYSITGHSVHLIKQLPTDLIIHVVWQFQQF